MALALAPRSSSNTNHCWPRLSPSTSRDPSFSPAVNLYDRTPGSTGTRPSTASGTPLMNSVTNPNATSPNAFTPKSSRFNLAAVIGFGSKSKKQQQELPEPPSQTRSLPTLKSNSHKEWGVSQPPPNPRLSHGVASSTSRTSRASTEGPLTPADDPKSPGARIYYQHSLMTLADLGDPFASTAPLNDHRLSAHSDRSLSRRLMQKIDGRTSRTSARLPVGDMPKDSRERSATLPSRASTSTDASEAYQLLRTVEPPWALSNQPELQPGAATRDHSKTVRGFSGVRHSKSSKPTLPWSESQASREKGFLQSHQRTHSSTSISKQYVADSTRPHASRPSTSSSVITSPPTLTSHLSFSSYSPGLASQHPVDEQQVVKHLLRTSASAQTTPTYAQGARTSPRPPPTTELPPTPTFVQPLGSRLHPPASPSAEEHSMRSRSGTTASASSMSFASSLSSLSFNSRPSPQDPPAVGADDYPSLLDETLPIPGAEADNTSPQHARNPKSSRSRKDNRVHGPAGAIPAIPGPASPRNDTLRPAIAGFPGTRPHPSLPSSAPLAVNTTKRDRASSVTSPVSDVGRTLRKQRSFHNTSLHAPTSTQRPLRHSNSYNSLDPSVSPLTRARSPPLPTLRSPPMLPLRSPPPPPPQELPPLPPPLVGTGKRSGSGKDSSTNPSPRRKLFGVTKHDRDRERKHELDNVDTSPPTSIASPRNGSASSSGPTQPSSSWYDDRGTGSEPPSASSSASPSTAVDVAQHIVPPAELLRLGAEWERENERRNGLRRAKSSWGSRDSNSSRTSFGSSLRAPIQSIAGDGSPPPASSSSSKFPRSSLLLSKASSAPSFGRAHGAPLQLSLVPSNSAVPPDSYTSLSPPPPRRQRTLSRTSQHVSSGLLPPPPRMTSPTSTLSSGFPPPKGALIERKPSFLDMTTSRHSVTLDVPDLSDPEEDERDSFLELSRGKNSIETIRESISSMDSFMQ